MIILFLFVCLFGFDHKKKKVYFANERTLLSWLSVATFLAVSAVRFGGKRKTKCDFVIF